MENEEWRDIAGYEGQYQVSNLGNVKSLDKYVNHFGGGKRLRKGKILKPNTDNVGYKYIVIYKNKKNKTYKIHRLVAQAFIPNPDNLPQVNHKDENKLNNTVDNLEWCDCKYNVNYGTAIQRRVEKQSKPVLQYTLNGEFVAEYPSIMEASRQTGINQAHISDCCNKKKRKAINGLYYIRNSTGGYFWKFKD